MRVGIFVVHGIAPHPRYEIQDQFSVALQGALNASNAARQWTLTSEYQPLTVANNPEQVRATVDRLSNGADNLEVVEGYWSPIDKGRTTPTSVAAWLLKSLFVPLNNRAKYPGWFGKACFDIVYVVSALLIIGALLGAMLWFAQAGYRDVIWATLVPSFGAPTFESVLANPLQLFNIVSLREAVLLATMLAGAVCVAQVISAVLGGALVRRTRYRATPPPATHMRRTVARIVFVAVVGLLVLAGGALVPLDNGAIYGSGGLLFVLAILALQGASSLGRGFLVDRIGDIQIYCLSDENSAFFTLREEIRTLVETTLLGMIQRRGPIAPGAASAPAYYDRIVVAGHSLGSTIAMDALLRLHEVHEAAPNIIGDDDWGRIRMFLTFGTALEKTKFFFAARNPSFSAKREEWTNDLCGHLFTASPQALTTSNLKTAAQPAGIFWQNVWYSTDIVANAIETYESREVPRIRGRQTPRKHPVSLNRQLSIPLWKNLFPHSSYLGDPRFWMTDATGAGAVDLLEAVLSSPQ
ncbi:MAG TPA: hypothetical protein VHT05_04335 [Candidatus Elarobacter sp.]|nr:hypothetical protein [Candidatus Elarobacter sp.]